MKHRSIEGIIIPTAESWADAIELIRSDFYRTSGRRTASVWGLWREHFRSPGLCLSFYLRLSQYRPHSFGGRLLRRIFVARLKCCQRRHCLHIPYPVMLGYGLHLLHGHGVIVSENAVIGSNVTLSQFSTIGGDFGERAPRIADGCYLAPSVNVIGPVSIGHNSCIGAGATVTRDIPAECTAAGVPARVLHADRSYQPRNPWPLPENI